MEVNVVMVTAIQCGFAAADTRFVWLKSQRRYVYYAVCITTPGPVAAKDVR